MIDDLKKSINSNLYERVSSPLFGAFTISWLLWNWKILYLTFFISEKTIKTNKIDYIVCNFSDVQHLVVYPVISTFILLTIMPFLSNGAFWLHLKFQKWKVDKKHQVEKSKLLTVQQSLDLRMEISEKENLFEAMLTGKDSEIKALKLKLEEVSKINSQENRADIPKPKTDGKTKKQELSSEQVELLKIISERDNIEERNIQSKLNSTQVQTKYNLGELESGDYIEGYYDNLSEGRYYKVTHKGRKFLVENKYV